MKSYGQLSLAVIILIGLVAGVTFIAQYQSGTGEAPKPPPVVDKSPVSQTVPVVTVVNPKVEWNPTWMSEVEQHMPGHYDYWLTNDSDTPIEIGLVKTSCKCSSVFGCILPPDQAKIYQQWLQLMAANTILHSSEGLLSGISRFTAEMIAAPSMLHAEPKWGELKADGKDGIVFPPKHAGMLRLQWAARKDKLGSEMIWAELWSQPREGEVRPRQVMKVELPVHFVSPLLVNPLGRNVEDLSAGEKRSMEFICWSPTRASFPLEVFDKDRHPCIKCEATPLSTQDLNKYVGNVKSRMLSGYHVRVTVQERINETTQMDVGPMSRRIVFRSSADIEDAAAILTGTIKGEVTVGDEKGKGRASLGSFKSANGASVTVPIQAERYGLEIDTDPGSIRYEPDYLQKSLKATLKKLSGGSDKRGRWALHLQVAPGALTGFLPDRSAVFLKIAGAQGRSIRIPVEGVGYQ